MGEQLGIRVVNLCFAEMIHYTQHSCNLYLFLYPLFSYNNPEYTGSRPITEVKQRQARLVLGWETAWEYQVL